MSEQQKEKSRVQHTKKAEIECIIIISLKVFHIAI